MKKTDQYKDDIQNVQITITAPKILIERLEDASKKAGITPSKYVGMLLQQYVMTEEAFHSEMAKYHYGKMQEQIFMRDQIQLRKEVLGR